MNEPMNKSTSSKISAEVSKDSKIGMNFSVTDAINRISLSKDMLKLIQNKDEVWGTFGKSNSHLLRAKLFKLFEKEKVSSNTILMVFILFAAIKNQKRVLDHIDNLPQEIASMPEISSAKAFINKRIVQYFSQENSEKFAAIHLPTTMPGLDITLTAVMYSKSEENFNMLIGKQTFAQINIDSNLQALNKTAQMDFWNRIVTNSRNPEEGRKGKKMGFVEEYYNTSANDKYLLMDKNLKEVMPSNREIGYTMEDLKSWYNNLKN